MLPKIAKKTTELPPPATGELKSLNVLLFSPSPIPAKEVMLAFKGRTNVDLRALVNIGRTETANIELAPSTQRDKELRIDVKLTCLHVEGTALSKELSEMDQYLLCLEEEDMDGNLDRALLCCTELLKGRVDGAEAEASDGKSQRPRHRIPISVVFVQKPPSTKPMAEPTPTTDIDLDTDQWWQQHKAKFHDKGVYPQGVLCIPSVMRPGSPTGEYVRTYLEKLVADHALREPPLPPTAPKKKRILQWR